MSVGLDRRIVCYDVHNKKWVTYLLYVSICLSVCPSLALSLFLDLSHTHFSPSHPPSPTLPVPSHFLALSPLYSHFYTRFCCKKTNTHFVDMPYRPVKIMEAESPLTSIDLLHNGATLAVGSSRGKIYIYDLRHGAQPISTISTAHKSSVQCLKFQYSVGVCL